MSIFIFYILFSFVVSHSAYANVQVRAVKHGLIPLALCLDSHDVKDQLHFIAPIIKKDFEYSKQFAVTVIDLDGKITKKTIGKIYDQGFPLALFVSYRDKAATFELRLYDTGAYTMIGGKEYKKRGTSMRGWAHNISDVVWPLVMNGQEGSFSSKLAYCKEVLREGKHRMQHVCMSDYDGSNEQFLVTTPTVNVAPRFNTDPHKPLLFYSENTNKNMCLMYVDMHKRRAVSSNFDGINMLPSFSADGTQGVYCASRGWGNCNIFFFKKGVLQQITNNKKNNVSPVITADGSQVYYCSDNQSSAPQLFVHTLADGTEKQLTQCAGGVYSPTYSEKNGGMVAYCKKAQGTLQVCVYEQKTGQHRQVTHTSGNKDECSWSPCGNYIAYCKENGNKSQIAVMNVATQEELMVTAAGERCSYPTWSPHYIQYPEVV